jgi:hypothetical protein
VAPVAPVSPLSPFSPFCPTVKKEDIPAEIKLAMSIAATKPTTKTTVVTPFVVFFKKSPFPI